MPPIQPAPGDSPEDDMEEDLSSNLDQPILISDSESGTDDENGGHDGYELLSQDPDNCQNDLDDEEEDSNFTAQNQANLQACVFDAQTLLLPAPSDSMKCDDEISVADTSMDDDHIEKIKDVMKSIILPTSNLPQWANSVPEEEWKAQLFMQMSSRKIRDKDSSGISPLMNKHGKS